MAEFHISETSPAFVPDLPRDFRGGEGTVTQEVGYLQKAEGKKFWNCIQFIEMNDGDDHIRTGYYTESGGWQNKPLMLPPDAFSDLLNFAEGKVL